MTNHTWNITVSRGRLHLLLMNSEVRSLFELTPTVLIKQMCDEGYRNGLLVRMTGHHVKCYYAGTNRMAARIVFNELTSSIDYDDRYRMVWQRSERVLYGFMIVVRPFVVFNRIVVPRFNSSVVANQDQVEK